MAVLQESVGIVLRMQGVSDSRAVCQWSGAPGGDRWPTQVGSFEENLIKGWCAEVWVGCKTCCRRRTRVGCCSQNLRQRVSAARDQQRLSQASISYPPPSGGKGAIDGVPTVRQPSGSQSWVTKGGEGTQGASRRHGSHSQGSGREDDADTVAG